MAEKIKLAFYIESMAVGGAEKVLIDLVNNLDQKKFDITVISIFKKSVYSDYQVVFEDTFLSHIKYRYLIDNSKTLLYKSFNFLYNKIPKEIFHKIFIKEKYDIEVAFYEGLPTEFVGFSTQESKKVAWLHVHQSQYYHPETTKEKLKEKGALYKKFDAIVGVSDDVCFSFSHFFSKFKPICLYNPLNEAIIIKKSQEESDCQIPFNVPYFVSVGRLIQRKGYDRLLRVLYVLKENGLSFKVIIAGEGEERSNLEKLSEQFRLTNDVRFIGNLLNPYSLIKNAELFICSSIQEGLSTVVTEALILGIPIVTTDCSGMNELVENDITGIICKNDEESLYFAIKSMLDHPEKLRQFKRNLTTSKERFSLKNRMAAIETFFESLN